MSASSDYLNVLSRLTEAKGAATAEAVRANSNLWGSTIGNIGNMIAQYPEQQAKMKEIANRAALTNLERQREQRLADAEQRGIQGQQTANAVIAALPRNADGTYDTGALMQKLAAGGVPLEAQEKLATSIDNINKISSSYGQAKIDHAADLANSILTAHDPKEPVTWDAVHFGIAAAKPFGLASEQDEKSFADLEAKGADPEQVLKAVRNQSPKYKKSTEPIKLGPGDQLRDPNTFDVLATNPKGETEGLKTVNEVKIAASDPASPLHDRAVEILKNLPPSETVSGPAEDERYRQIQAKPAPARTPDEEAWSAAYEKQKMLGIDASASFAAQRQASTQAQQNAIQARAQGFQESQAGRKELTDKVEQPYQTAQAGVDTLRETIQAAKEGNVVAGQLQSLLTTMATLKAEGFNRINTAEIGATGNAGSMFQRIEGWFGKAKAGQPIPPDVQKDMAAYADILEKSAYRKYQSGFQTTTKRYGLTDEKPLPPPVSAGAAPSAAAPAAGGVDVVAPNGKTYHFATAGQAEAFKARAGIK